MDIEILSMENSINPFNGKFHKSKKEGGKSKKKKGGGFHYDT